MQLLRQRDSIIPLTRACRAIGVPLSTAKRHLRPNRKASRPLCARIDASRP